MLKQKIKKLLFLYHFYSFEISRVSCSEHHITHKCDKMNISLLHVVLFIFSHIAYKGITYKISNLLTSGINALMLVIIELLLPLYPRPHIPRMSTWPFFLSFHHILARHIAKFRVSRKLCTVMQKVCALEP